MLPVAEHQYLTFLLGAETYALEVAKVREVLSYTDITAIPQMPAYMQGIINLRGHVVPVIDLRTKFGMKMSEVTQNTSIIIMDTALGSAVVIGAVADAVHEVVEILPDAIEPAPKLGTTLKTEFIQGIGKKDNEFIIILNIDSVFGEDELALISQPTEEAAV